MRLPVAWNTALATAAATPVAPSSPIPLAPSGLASMSTSSTKWIRMSGMSAFTDGDARQVLRQPAAEIRLMLARFHRGHAPAPDDPAGHLAASGPRVDDAAGAVAADHPPQPQPQEPELGIDRDLDEDGPEGADHTARAMTALLERRIARQRELALSHDLVRSGAT